MLTGCGRGARSHEGAALIEALGLICLHLPELRWDVAEIISRCERCESSDGEERELHGCEVRDWTRMGSKLDNEDKVLIRSQQNGLTPSQSGRALYVPGSHGIVIRLFAAGPQDPASREPCAQFGVELSRRFQCSLRERFPYWDSVEWSKPSRDESRRWPSRQLVEVKLVLGQGALSAALAQSGPWHLPSSRPGASSSVLSIFTPFSKLADLEASTRRHRHTDTHRQSMRHIPSHCLACCRRHPPDLRNHHGARCEIYNAGAPRVLIPGKLLCWALWSRWPSNSILVLSVLTFKTFGTYNG